MNRFATVVYSYLLDMTVPQDIRKIVLAFGPLEHVSSYVPIMTGEYSAFDVVYRPDTAKQSSIKMA